MTFGRSVGTGFVDVKPRTAAFFGDLQRKMRAEGDASGKAFASRFTAGLGNLGVGVAKALAVGVGVAAAGAAAGLTKAVLSASDLNETLSKTQQVFGAATGQVTGFADELAKKFGVPKREILDAASNIGLVAKAAGLAEPAAAKMSTELAKLAVDASSFFNVPLDQALEKIRAGLVGEAEPLRSFGVLLSEAAVQAEAQALGLGKASGESSKLAKANLRVSAAEVRLAKAVRDHGRNSSQAAQAQIALQQAQLGVEDSAKSAKVELTEQQKVQARHSIITRQMAAASGDLERTQNSLANVIKFGVRGQLSNMAADLGTKLLPAAQQLAIVTRDRLIPALGAGLTRIVDELAPKIETQLVPAIIRFSERLPVIVDNLVPQLVSLMERLGPFIDKASTALEKFKFGDISKASIALLALKAGAATGTPQGLALGAAIAAGLGLNIAIEKYLGPEAGDLGRLPGVSSGSPQFGPNVPLENIPPAFREEERSKRRLAEAERRQRGGQTSFGGGGTVPGPLGAPRLVLAHGGETILPTHKNASAERTSSAMGGDVYLNGQRMGTWQAREFRRRARARS